MNISTHQKEAKRAKLRIKKIDEKDINNPSF